MLVSGNHTINSVLNHRLKVDSGECFLVFEPIGGGWQEISYADFGSLVASAVQALRSIGITRGDKIALFLGNRPEFLVYLFAGQRIGAVIVPAITHYKAEELRYVLAHCEARCVITETSLLEVATAASDEGRIQCICIDDPARLPKGWAAVATVKAELEADLSAPADTGLIMYSSGTTSRPKGIEIACGAMLLAAESNAAHQRLQPQDRSLCMAPLFHANALFISALAAFVTGSTVILLEKFDEKRWIAQARVYKATVGSLVAAAVKRILSTPEKPGDDLNDLRFVLYGMPVAEQQIADFEKRFDAPLINLWGMTENIATGTRSPIYLPRKPERIGLPMWGMEIELRDPEGNAIRQPDESGVAYFRGSCILTAYHRDPEATETLFSEDGWLNTGDIMAVDQQGYFTFLDRAKDVIKVRGENVSSAEVERVLLEHGAIAEAAVFGVPDEKRDERIVALLVLKPGATADFDNVREHCSSLMAFFKIPHEFVVVEDLLKTSMGKLRKNEMRKAYQETLPK